MDQSIRNVAKNMRRIGLGALAHANWHALHFSFENDCWSELSVLQAAHAAELLIKARIAEENPLLIFEKFPKLRSTKGQRLSFQALVDGGKTIQFSELPDRLWAATGIEIPLPDTFMKFGNLRNTIQHFAPPENVNISQATLEFIFGVVDPLINEFWQLYAVDFNEDHEPYIYFVPGLISRKIRFLVSKTSVEDFGHMDIEWPSDQRYADEMKKRIREQRP